MFQLFRISNQLCFKSIYESSICRLQTYLIASILVADFHCHAHDFSNKYALFQAMSSSNIRKIFVIWNKKKLKNLDKVCDNPIKIFILMKHLVAFKVSWWTESSSTIKLFKEYSSQSACNLILKVAYFLRCGGYNLFVFVCFKSSLWYFLQNILYSGQCHCIKLDSNLEVIDTFILNFNNAVVSLNEVTICIYDIERDKLLKKWIRNHDSLLHHLVLETDHSSLCPRDLTKSEYNLTGEHNAKIRK